MRRGRILVSLHVPKTGGTVFGRKVLRKVIAEGEMQGVYRARHIHGVKIPKGELRPGTRLLHGHFRWDAVAHLGDLVTWVRDPLARTLSHWSYSIKKPRWGVAWATAKPGESFWAYCQRFPNFMSLLLGGDLDKFACVGVLEHWTPSILAMGEVLGLDLRRFATAGFSKRQQKLYGPRPPVPLTDKQVEEFMELNKADYRLYEEAKRRLHHRRVPGLRGD